MALHKSDFSVAFHVVYNKFCFQLNCFDVMSMMKKTKEKMHFFPFGPESTNMAYRFCTSNVSQLHGITDILTHTKQRKKT